MYYREMRRAFDALAGGVRLSQVVRTCGLEVVRDCVLTWAHELLAEGELHRSTCRYMRRVRAL